MQISMKQSNGCSTAHDIEVNFQSGALIKMTVSGTETAIEVYKAILFAYESGQDDNANRNLIRNIKQAAEKARERG